MAKPIDRTYISPYIKGYCYIAEYERRNSRALRWSIMHYAVGLDVLIDARKVPLQARRERSSVYGEQVIWDG